MRVKKVKGGTPLPMLCCDSEQRVLRVEDSGVQNRFSPISNRVADIDI